MINRLAIVLLLPALSHAAVQCYVGQKLFSFESSNAVCAKFIPYSCAVNCEWRRQCNEHSSFAAFKGRRTFVAGLLLNSKSLMVLCCASLASRVETDGTGREKCVWREPESIAVLGPSIRTNPVLAPNHYLRDIKLERDGTSRVDVSLEVCQYISERESCKVEDMNEADKKRFNLIQLKLQRAQQPTSSPSTATATDSAAGDDDFVKHS